MPNNGNKMHINEIVKQVAVYCNCKRKVSASVLPFYIILALPDDGRNYRPKHAVGNVMKK
jgi:hypothetical protein